MSVWADVRKPLQPDQPPPEMPSVWATPEDTPAALPSATPDVRGPRMQLSTDTANRADLNKIANHDQMVHDINALNDVRWKQAHPWGSPENHPGHLGKLAHVFSQIGNIAGNIVAPNVMARIPGTQLGMQEQAGELEHNIDTEQQHEAENEQRQATAGNLESETETRKAQLPYIAPQSEARTRLENAQAQDLEQTAAAGPNLAIGHAHAVNQAIARGVDPAKDPLVQQYEDAIQRIQKQPAEKSLQQVTTLGPDGKPHTYGVDTTGKKVVDYGVHYERPITVNTGEKGFEYSDKALTAVAKPIEELAMRMGRLKDTMAQGTPQADALVAPELLTVMAGGQGSGLRMNEAEIARVIGGRSAWENLKASIQHWSTDPTAARSITPEQDHQIRALIQHVDGKMQKKLGILNDARSRLVDVSDPTEQHRLVAQTRQQLQGIDVGNDAAPQGATQEVWKNGALIGHVVGNKFVPVEANAH